MPRTAWTSSPCTPGINRSVVKTFKETGRLMNIVSRGGSLLFGWMEVTGNENPSMSSTMRSSKSATSTT